jgi:hypothetical protein
MANSHRSPHFEGTLGCFGLEWHRRHRKCGRTAIWHHRPINGSSVGDQVGSPSLRCQRSLPGDGAALDQRPLGGRACPSLRAVRTPASLSGGGGPLGTRGPRPRSRPPHGPALGRPIPPVGCQKNSSEQPSDEASEFLPLALGELVPEGRAVPARAGPLQGRGGTGSDRCLRMGKLLVGDHAAGTTGPVPAVPQRRL